MKSLYKAKDEGAKENLYVMKNNMYFISKQKICFYACLHSNRRSHLFELKKQTEVVFGTIILCQCIERHTSYSVSKIIFL